MFLCRVAESSSGSYVDPYIDDVVFQLAFNGVTPYDIKGHALTGDWVVTTGKYGNGVAVTGSSTANIAPSIDFELPGKFTMEFWVKMDAISNITLNSVFSYGLYNNGVLLRNYTGSSLWINGSAVGVSEFAQADGMFRHIAIVRDSDINNMEYVHLYVDGVKIASSPWAVNGLVNNGGLGIMLGRSAHNPTYEYMTGVISNVRITKGVARYLDNFTPPSAAF